MAHHRVRPGTRIRLGRIDPADTGKHADEAAVRAKLGQDIARLAKLQDVLYAERRHAVLVVLQGMDTSGKDGTVKHVMSGVNPSGCEVVPFKVPTEEEAAHDFLWRAHLHAPARGEVVIFNRSHYEDVLVVRVHELVPRSVWSKRYDRINDFERNLIDGGTHILKFFLHISEDEQLERFRQRLEDPARRWKISEADYEERAFWPQYMEAYEEALARTSTEDAPWYVIPANHKWFRNLAVAKIVVETMESLDMKFPPPRVDIDEIRRKYHEAARHRRGKRPARPRKGA